MWLDSPMAATPVFPSLVIRADELAPQGAFAEAQAAYLSPDAALVEELDALLRSKKIGVVAHFYMGPELQGVLAGCSWQHIQTSDSLKMADAAIEMVEGGCEAVIVLGVDFMSENVRAMLSASGYPDVPVYRVTVEPIGCSLAESAEAKAYGAYLTRASLEPLGLHVVYINTSLVTKAKAHHLVPTITCTSSNVVQTVLQAAAQVPDVRIWFGPDTYMGENLKHLFTALAKMPDQEVRALHPGHDAASVRALTSRFNYFEEGACVVHHMFGADVVAQVREHYADAFVTAHLEVPGEMFALSLEAQKEGRGVVGSTSNILSFITEQLRAAVQEGADERLSFVLGTEAGMITPIVRQTQAILADALAQGGPAIEVEIIFPVASEAITVTDDAELAIVPGVASGEGCSVAGGCATCPYMKMNSLDALLAFAKRFGVEKPADLAGLHPRDYSEQIGGRTAADLGSEPILHMRHFQRTGALSDGLVADIEHRNS